MAKKHKRKTDKRAFKLKLKPQTYASIAQVVFASLAVLIIISFSRSGLALVRFNDFVMGIFGFATIFLPFIFLSFAFLMSNIKIPLSQPNVIIGSILVFLSIAGLGKSGNLGLVFWDGVSTLVTPYGAVVIFLGLIVTGLIVLFNTSFDAVFKFLQKMFATINLYIYGQKTVGGGRILPRKDFKISGSTTENFSSGTVKVNNPAPIAVSKPKENLEEKIQEVVHFISEGD